MYSGFQEEGIKTVLPNKATAKINQILNIPVVLLGFSLDSENFHAPNEHFHLENFYKGMETICEYWYELAKLQFD